MPSRRRGACKACGRNRLLVGRGLCSGCYGKPTLRAKYPPAFACKPWSAGQDAQLRRLAGNGRDEGEISDATGRTLNAVRHRLRRLGLRRPRKPGGRAVRNEYRFELVAACPVDRAGDCYRVTVRAGRTIPVEEILKAAKEAAREPAYQEALTEALSRALAAEVETVGSHSGVEVRCVCGPAS